MSLRAKRSNPSSLVHASRRRLLRRAVALLAMTAVWAVAAARADDAIKLAVGARGNWETAAAELGQGAGFFRKRGIALDILYTQGSGETQQVVIFGSVGIGVRL